VNYCGFNWQLLMYNFIDTKQNCFGNKECVRFKLIMLMGCEDLVQMFEGVLEGACLSPHVHKTFAALKTQVHKIFSYLDPRNHKKFTYLDQYVHKTFSDLLPRNKTFTCLD
jgi:hypothetical protein